MRRIEIDWIWKNGMDIAEVVVACISDLAFNMSEYPAKDLELFSQHAGRKTVNMEDVILTVYMKLFFLISAISIYNLLESRVSSRVIKSEKLACINFSKSTQICLLIITFTAHRNEGLAAMSRTISLELKGKEPQAESGGTPYWFFHSANLCILPVPELLFLWITVRRGVI